MADGVTELLSTDGQHKVSIARRRDGLFLVSVYKWTHEIVKGYGEVDAFWASVERPSLTDTFANAMKLADERLRAYSQEMPKP